ncbi:hypothetical protein SASPL_141354 [Salvia splendens]|uniref:MLO-like protein n=1 Tax=Salvia splendens TaxID=180675 RepID=A0A8X8ZDC5_SALSN|nr:hypothetical protein SASPL_141354 [Salvia splendens]
MVFGLLSVLMGHWITFVANMCIKPSTLMSSRFYPCSLKSAQQEALDRHTVAFSSGHFNSSISHLLLEDLDYDYCPEDREPFASYESLEQLHRFLFVLGVTHVSYSFLAIALAMIKLENMGKYCKKIVRRGLITEDTFADTEDGEPIRRILSFVAHHTSHPWSRNRLLVWLLCFSRQFWSSISQADYMTLRLGFITTHQLAFTYDFHNYMLRSMEEEFRDIVGISIPLWIFAITCIALGFHGVLFSGTRNKCILLDLFLSYHSKPVDRNSDVQSKGRALLICKAQAASLVDTIHIVSECIQDDNVYMWEIRAASCYTEDHTFLAIRLIFGYVSSHGTTRLLHPFPSYPPLFVMRHARLLVALQMGSKFKKTIVPGHVRQSLHGWRRTNELPTSNEELQDLVHSDPEPQIFISIYVEMPKTNQTVGQEPVQVHEFGKPLVTQFKCRFKAWSGLGHIF